MSCESCGRGCALELTAEEIALLERLGEIPFLPMAGRTPEDTPVFLEDGAEAAEARGRALLGLAGKGLVRLDWDLPLRNFDYRAYGAYPLHGSIALTARGQAAVELLEIQGIGE